MYGAWTTSTQSSSFITQTAGHNTIHAGSTHRDTDMIRIPPTPPPKNYNGWVVFIIVKHTRVRRPTCTLVHFRPHLTLTFDLLYPVSNSTHLHASRPSCVVKFSDFSFDNFSCHHVKSHADRTRRIDLTTSITTNTNIIYCRIVHKHIKEKV